MGDRFLLASGRTFAKAKLSDAKLLELALAKLVELIGMKPLRQPVVTRAYGNPGLEGYVPIDASNITISTYTVDPRVVVSIHSCRTFEAEPIFDYLQQCFDCLEIRSASVAEENFQPWSGSILGRSAAGG